MVIIQKGLKIRALLFHLGGRHIRPMEMGKERWKKEDWEEKSKRTKRKEEKVQETAGRGEKERMFSKCTFLPLILLHNRTVKSMWSLTTSCSPASHSLSLLLFTYLSLFFNLFSLLLLTFHPLSSHSRLLCLFFTAVVAPFMSIFVTVKGMTSI